MIQVHLVRVFLVVIIVAVLGAAEPGPAFACPETSLVAAVEATAASAEDPLLAAHPEATLLIGGLSIKQLGYRWQRVETGEPAWGRSMTAEPVARRRPDGDASLLLEHLAGLQPPLAGGPVYLAWISDLHRAGEQDEIRSVRLEGEELLVTVEGIRIGTRIEEIPPPPDRRSLRLWRLPPLPAGNYTVRVDYRQRTAFAPGTVQEWLSSGSWGASTPLALPATATFAMEVKNEPSKVVAVDEGAWLPPAALLLREMGQLTPPLRIRTAAGGLEAPAADLAVTPGLWGYGRFCDLSLQATTALRYAEREPRGRLPTLCQVHELKPLQDAGVPIHCYVPWPRSRAQVVCPTIWSLEHATLDRVTAGKQRDHLLEVILWRDDGPRDKNSPWVPVLLVDLPERPLEVPAIAPPPPPPPARVAVTFTFYRADRPGGWYRPEPPAPAGAHEQWRLQEAAAPAPPRPAGEEEPAGPE